MRGERLELLVNKTENLSANVSIAFCMADKEWLPSIKCNKFYLPYLL
jgi:hypothetical protein